MSRIFPVASCSSTPMQRSTCQQRRSGRCSSEVSFAPIVRRPLIKFRYNAARPPLLWQPRRALANRGRRHALEESEDHGPELVALDPESEGGLGGTSEEVLGPLAALLIGFLQSEVESFRTFMIDMEADMVKIIACTGDMLEMPLCDALSAPVPSYEQPKLGTPRAVILSGMYTGELLEVISYYKDSGLPGTLWAAAVPGNWDRPVKTLVEDIYKDHQYMVEQEQNRSS